MGWMLAVGAIARMLGPFWAVQSLQLSVKLCFGSTAFLLLVAIVLLLFSWKDCDGHPYSKHNEKTHNS